MKHQLKYTIFYLLALQACALYGADTGSTPWTLSRERLEAMHTSWLEHEAAQSTQHASQALEMLEASEEHAANQLALKGAAGTLLAGSVTVAAKALAGPALQRSVQTRVFGIDDAAIASVATSTMGAIGSKAIAAIPVTLAVLAGGYGLYKINRMLHAECRSHVAEVKYEMAQLLQRAEEKRKRDYERLVRRYDEQVEHMERHIRDAKDNVEGAREQLEALEGTIAETRATNEAMKAKMAQALPLIQRLVTQTSTMASSAGWDLKAARARAAREARTGVKLDKPAPQKSRWKFWQ